MRILITGITGLLGSYLARTFINEGQIFGLRRKQSDLRLLGKYAEKIEWIDGDVSDIISLEEAVAGMDLVIHTAGVVSFNRKDASLLMKTNVEGTKNVVNAMLAMKVSKLIHVSSVSALGRNIDTKLIDENTTWTDSDLNTAYAISKYLGELEVWRGAQEGLEALVVYPSVLLGKISDDRSSTRIYNYVLEEKSYYPSGNINFLDVRDAAEMIFQLYHKAVWGDRFILNNSAVPYKYFFEQCAKAFDRKAPSKKVTPFLLLFALLTSWLGRKFGVSKSSLNSQTATLSQMEVTMVNEKVQHLLKFKFRSLTETLQWAISNENR